MAAARALVERLRERKPEIEAAALLRVKAVSDLPPGSGPEYAEGLRTAVAAALEHGIEGIEQGEEAPPPVPLILLSQARLAAASGVGLDVVLRRYVAGQALLGDFVVQEAGDLAATELKRLLRRLAAIVDDLLTAVSGAYAEERERRTKSAERRRTERVERLLDGEPLDTSGLGYEFDAHHLAIVAYGPRAEQAVVAIAASLEARLLSVPREKGLLWAWLGSHRALDPERAKQLALVEARSGLALSIGEPGAGIAGWRLTHHQAAAGFVVALHAEAPVARYAEVSLLASVMQDELLINSLHRLYLEPLERERDRGEIALETLRAYFATEQNLSSAAVILNVDRRTVSNRLRAVEERIGRKLSACGVELLMALRLNELRERGPSHSVRFRSRFLAHWQYEAGSPTQRMAGNRAPASLRVTH